MKRVLMIVLVLLGMGMGAVAQDNVVYTCIVNKVPDGFNFPLIGFFNKAYGSHISAHIGLGNWNEDDFAGGQISLVNTVGGRLDGSQVGLFNLTGDEVRGLQLGLINTVGEGVIGSQIGLVNVAEETVGAQLSLVNATETLNGIQFGLVNGTETLNGLQFGLVNASESLSGFQCGLVNATETLNGARLGLINAAEELNGVELGLVNVAENLNGFQLGLVNVVESADNGLALGLVTIAEEGGYRALEVSTSEMFPVNVSYKLGMKPLYTFYTVSYDQRLPHYLAIGIGIGTNLPLSETLYFNPELMTQNKVISENTFLYSLGLNVGYCLTDKLHLTAGPSIVWNHAGNSSDLFNESFAIRKWSPDSKNNLFLGARIGIRYVFSDF